MTFEGLGIDAKLIQATDELGFVNPTPIQEKAIPVLLSGTTSIVIVKFFEFVLYRFYIHPIFSGFV